jgi:hypothetical protein
MGVAGHIGVAFDPADEADAIAAVNGKPVEKVWWRHNTDFGLTRENFWEFHQVLQKLVAADASLAPMETIVIGNRRIGEGPVYYMCLYPSEEVQQIARAFARVTDTALARAISEARGAEFVNLKWFPENLADVFRHIGSEVETVAVNHWSLIGFMA